MMTNFRGRILWWGRHGNYGPDYPRNRTLIECLQSLGYQVIEFHPRISKLADFEANFRKFESIDLVWVPCFRQRDISSASRWAKKRNVSLIFDPLISAYDKRVYEKKKYKPESRKAKNLLKWEKNLFSLADIVIADTICHKEYYIKQFSCTEEKVFVIPVSAEESLFYPKESLNKEVPEILFFGTFIGLQGPKYIAESIKFYQGPPIKLTFLGDGPERKQCEEITQKVLNQNISVSFESWIDFHDLPERIRQSDVCLGIFGTGDKSHRVIPNKVYQALAVGKPVVTMESTAYPSELLRQENQGLYFCKAGDPKSIADSISKLITLMQHDQYDSSSPRKIYDNYFSNNVIKKALLKLIDTCSESKA